MKEHKYRIILEITSKVEIPGDILREAAFAADVQLETISDDHGFEYENEPTRIEKVEEI